MKQLHIFVSGRVQGVGYRRFVRHWARKLELTGWVQNLPDRRVEAVFQGREKEIGILLHRCRRGPLLADVTDIQKTWEDSSENFDTFMIRKLK